MEPQRGAKSFFSARRRPAAATIICTFLLAPSAAASLFDGFSFAANAIDPSKRARCIAERSHELAELSACGDKGSLAYCFTNPKQQPPLGLDDVTHYLLRAAKGLDASDLEVCFTNAGCTASEAAIEAEWTVRRCDERGDKADMADLRRRQDDATDKQTSTSQKRQQQTTTPAQRTTTQPRQQTTTQQQQTQTQQDDTTTDAPTTDAAPESTTVVGVTTTPPSTRAATTTGPSSTTTGPLVCHTPTTVLTTFCPVQSTGPNAGKETLACFSTTTSFLVCATGLRCMTDSQGLPICMRIQNEFTTAGVVVTIAFGAAALVSFASVCFFCLRDRNQQRKLERAAEAAAIAKEAKTAALLQKKRPSVNVRSVSGTSDVSQPLMPPSAPMGYSGGQLQQGGYLGASNVGVIQQPQQQQQYGIGQPDPFGDPHGRM